jgi:CoA:oxalate CoA-transferase
MAAESDGPLAGLTVLDFTRALAGPHATFIMAALGADVIKVEDPNGGDTARFNPPFYGASGPSMRATEADHISMSIMNRSRGKRGVTLNLKHPSAREIYHDLVQHADVVMENFSAGVSDRLGVGYEATRAIKEDIIFCAISGFGADQTPGLKAMDTMIQGMSGSTLSGGYPGGPPQMVGWPLADITTPLFAVIGVLAALQGRERSGKGDFIDVSMMGSLTSLVASEDWEVWRRMSMETRNGNRLPRLAPFGMYKCKTGYFTVNAGSRDSNAHKFFVAIDRPELVGDPNFSTIAARAQHDQELADIIESWAADRTVEEAVNHLVSHGVGAAPVLTPLEAVNHPIVTSRQETIPVLHPNLGPLTGLRTSGVPVKYDHHAVRYGRPAPHLGEHNDEIYGGLLGYSSEKLANLRKNGAI